MIQVICGERILYYNLLGKTTVLQIKHLVLKNTSWNSVQSFFLKLEGKLLSDSDSLVQVGMGANARFLLEPRFCGGLFEKHILSCSNGTYSPNSSDLAADESDAPLGGGSGSDSPGCLGMAKNISTVANGISPPGTGQPSHKFPMDLKFFCFDAEHLLQSPVENSVEIVNKMASNLSQHAQGVLATVGYNVETSCFREAHSIFLLQQVRLAWSSMFPAKVSLEFPLDLVQFCRQASVYLQSGIADDVVRVNNLVQDLSPHAQGVLTTFGYNLKTRSFKETQPHLLQSQVRMAANMFSGSADDLFRDVQEATSAWQASRASVGPVENTSCTPAACWNIGTPWSECVPLYGLEAITLNERIRAKHSEYTRNIPGDQSAASKSKPINMTLSQGSRLMASALFDAIFGNRWHTIWKEKQFEQKMLGGLFHYLLDPATWHHEGLLGWHLSRSTVLESKTIDFDRKMRTMQFRVEQLESRVEQLENTNKQWQELLKSSHMMTPEVAYSKLVIEGPPAIHNKTVSRAENFGVEETWMRDKEFFQLNISMTSSTKNRNCASQLASLSTRCSTISSIIEGFLKLKSWQIECTKQSEHFRWGKPWVQIEFKIQGSENKYFHTSKNYCEQFAHFNFELLKDNHLDVIRFESNLVTISTPLAYSPEAPLWLHIRIRQILHQYFQRVSAATKHVCQVDVPDAICLCSNSSLIVRTSHQKNSRNWDGVASFDPLLIWNAVLRWQNTVAAVPEIIFRSQHVGRSIDHQARLILLRLVAYVYQLLAPTPIDLTVMAMKAGVSFGDTKALGNMGPNVPLLNARGVFQPLTSHSKNTTSACSSTVTARGYTTITRSIKDMLAQRFNIQQTSLIGAGGDIVAGAEFCFDVLEARSTIVQGVISDKVLNRKTFKRKRALCDENSADSDPMIEDREEILPSSNGTSADDIHPLTDKECWQLFFEALKLDQDTINRMVDTGCSNDAIDAEMTKICLNRVAEEHTMLLHLLFDGVVVSRGQRTYSTTTGAILLSNAKDERKHFEDLTNNMMYSASRSRKYKAKAQRKINKRLAFMEVMCSDIVF